MFKIKELRKERGYTQVALAKQLQVKRSTISMWETGKSTPSYQMLEQMARLFQVSVEEVAGGEKKHPVLAKYLSLTARGRKLVDLVLDRLMDYETETEFDEKMDQEGRAEGQRMIPLYRTVSAVGDPTPEFGADFDYIPVQGKVPANADFAVGIQGDSMAPDLLDGEVAYVNRDVMEEGAVGIFCVDGQMVCRQYKKSQEGTVFLLPLNRTRRELDLTLPPEEGRKLLWYGRVILNYPPETKTAK